MTRIVAGSAGGRRLQVPRAGTRPTSERVREALFGRLEHYGLVAQARVVDLCAGSGALGLEAASRGAADVTLVESSRAAAQVCQANTRALGMGGVRTVVAKAERFLAGAAGAPVDLVLLDPPYDMPEGSVSAVLELLARAQDPWLSPGSVVVVERSARAPEPSWPAGLRRFSEKRYGETVLWFAEMDTADDAA